MGEDTEDNTDGMTALLAGMIAGMFGRSDLALPLKPYQIVDVGLHDGVSSLVLQFAESGNRFRIRVEQVGERGEGRDASNT